MLKDFFCPICGALLHIEKITITPLHKRRHEPKPERKMTCPAHGEIKFYLNKDPKIATITDAKSHCDAKATLEVAQK